MILEWNFYKVFSTDGWSFKSSRFRGERRARNDVLANYSGYPPDRIHCSQPVVFLLNEKMTKMDLHKKRISSMCLSAKLGERVGAAQCPSPSSWRETSLTASSSPLSSRMASRTRPKRPSPIRPATRTAAWAPLALRHIRAPECARNLCLATGSLRTI